MLNPRTVPYSPFQFMEINQSLNLLNADRVKNYGASFPISGFQTRQFDINPVGKFPLKQNARNSIESQSRDFELPFADSTEPSIEISAHRNNKKLILLLVGGLVFTIGLVLFYQSIELKQKKATGELDNVNEDHQ